MPLQPPSPEFLSAAPDPDPEGDAGTRAVARAAARAGAQGLGSDGRSAAGGRPGAGRLVALGAGWRRSVGALGVALLVLAAAFGLPELVN
jgi:hypothetical protein